MTAFETGTRRLATLAVFGGAVAFSGAAAAQGSITLSGIVDGGFGYSSNVRVAQSAGAAGTPAVYVGRPEYGFQSGTWNGDRWRLMGAEDLGAGRKALFYFENGFNLGTGAAGQSARLFGRQSWTGIADERLGTLTLGRQYDAIVDMVGAIGPTSFLTGMAAHPGDIDNVDNNARINSSIKYASPRRYGLQFEAVYGFGGEAGSVAARNAWSVGLAYREGPLNLAAAYLHANSDSAQGAWNGIYDGYYSSSINEGFASAARLDVFAAAMTYRYRALTAGLNWSNARYDAGAGSLFAGSAIFDTVQATLSWQATAALRLAGGYGYTHRSSVSDADSAQYHEFNLSAFYALSKRTWLYGLVGYQQASGATLDAWGNPVAATASLGDVSNGASSANGRQVVARLGLRQLF